MKKCLCCGKPFKKLSTKIESDIFGWHFSCIKEFFGTSELPDIDVSKEVLNQIAVDNTNKGFTVPGVQKKLSLHLSKEDIPRLTFVNYPTGYILKPQTEEYQALPEMEYLIRVTGVIRTCLKASLFKSFLRFVLERRQPICVLNAENPIKILRF